VDGNCSSADDSVPARRSAVSHIGKGRRMFCKPANAWLSPREAIGKLSVLREAARGRTGMISYEAAEGRMW